jgi:Phosphotransferase enzyme family
VPDRDQFRDYYSRLSALGLAPEIVDIRDDKLIAPSLVTLAEWEAAHLSSDERNAMGRRLVALLEQVHAAGFCHRDTDIRKLRRATWGSAAYRSEIRDAELPA